MNKLGKVLRKWLIDHDLIRMSVTDWHEIYEDTYENDPDYIDPNEVPYLR